MFILHRLLPHDLAFDKFHDGLQTYVYFLFLSNNAMTTVSLFSFGRFITHVKVSSKRGAYR